MALHTKKQFAELCGLTTGNLSVYKDRQKVVYSGDYVDDSIEPNLSFLKLRKEKLKSDSKPQKKTHPPPTKPSKLVVERPKTQAISAPKVQDPEGEGQIYNLTQKKLETQITKMNMEMDKLRLQNSKFMGEVVPFSLIKPCVMQHNQSIIAQSKNTLDNILRLFKKKRDLSADEEAEIRAHFVHELNDMMKKAAAATVKAVNAIVSEFSEKRNVGERT